MDKFSDLKMINCYNLMLIVDDMEICKSCRWAVIDSKELIVIVVIAGISENLDFLWNA